MCICDSVCVCKGLCIYERMMFLLVEVQGSLFLSVLFTSLYVYACVGEQGPV